MAERDDNGMGPARVERTDIIPHKRLITGKYQLGRLLGEGGMGAVYEAEHLSLGARVAVKLLNESVSGNPKSIARFRREARAMAAIRHDNVVTVTDAGEDEDGVPFLVMELLRGESLSSVIRRERRLTPEAAVTITLQILAGLAAAHDRGVIHRDLKPGNIFVTAAPEGGYRIKILDFGISKFPGGEITAELTLEGVMMGTPQYMAPEQARGSQDLDARVDIYSVGVLLYRMVTGKLPYTGNGPEDLYERIQRGQPVPPRDINAEIPEPLEREILRAMSVDRGQRHANARTFRAALQEATPGLPRDSAIHTPSFESLPAIAGSVDEFQVAPTMSAAPTGSAISLQHPPDDAAASPTRGARPAAVTPGQPEPRRPAGTPAAPSLSDVPTSQRRRRRGRTMLIGAAALALAAGGAGWLAFGPGDGGREQPDPTVPGDGVGRSVVPAGEPIRFGINRYMSHDEVLRKHTPLAEFLTVRLERPVELVILEEYEDLPRKIVSGELQFAALSPTAYVRAQRIRPGVRLLATPVKRGGISSYQGVILARAESDVQTLDDLRGRIFCFTHRGSASGYLYPRAALRAAGIDPDADFSSTQSAGDHQRALGLLLSGDCDGAAVFSNAWRESPDFDRFRLLASTDEIPYDAYVASRVIPEEEANALREALLSLSPGLVEARAIVGPADIEGFVAVEDSAYDPVRRLEELGEAASHETEPTPR